MRADKETNCRYRAACKPQRHNRSIVRILMRARVASVEHPTRLEKGIPGSQSRFAGIEGPIRHGPMNRRVARYDPRNHMRDVSPV